MGQFGRITALADLPSEKILLGYIRKARRPQRKAGVKVAGPQAENEKDRWPSRRI